MNSQLWKEEEAEYSFAPFNPGVYKGEGGIERDIIIYLVRLHKSEMKSRNFKPGQSIHQSMEKKRERFLTSPAHVNGPKGD